MLTQHAFRGFLAMCQTYIGYCRVSTAEQGKSGLGLEAQQMAVESFVKAAGADARLLASYTEVESGKRADRPELAKAMRQAKLTKSRLLIAKLDRLTRNVHFLTGLMEGGVEFVACDMPNANELTIHIMVAVAQAEAKAISARTKAALQAAKARGTKLGNPNGAKHLVGYDVKVAHAANKNKADARAREMKDTIDGYRAMGIESANAIAQKLNDDGIKPSRGERWYAKSVIRLMDRL
ncbi:resolvase [Labrys miyagiensis]|uniref:Resolvase n=1 Tax=Labrys miyagiensis TaxID=346912 RepID=A0ABQ6CX47_9HYPH|nr:recombinase family protein [Labrys miyagiensis]GLS22842.1 resolvase [Labrys miyagiensis]